MHQRSNWRVDAKALVYSLGKPNKQHTPEGAQCDMADNSSLFQGGIGEKK